MMFMLKCLVERKNMEETGDGSNDIKVSPPVSKTIVSYSIRGEISSDFFLLFLQKKLDKMIKKCGAP